MAELVRWKLENGGEVLVETRPDGPEISPVSRAGELIESASESLDAALGHVRDAASAVLNQFRGMATQPNKVEIEIGVTLTAQAGAVIAKTSIGGHLNVKLTWESNTSETPRPSATVGP